MQERVKPYGLASSALPAVYTGVFFREQSNFQVFIFHLSGNLNRAGAAGHVFVISTLFSSPLLLMTPHQFCLSPQRKTQQSSDPADRPHRRGREKTKTLVGSSGGRLRKGEKSSGVFVTSQVRELAHEENSEVSDSCCEVRLPVQENKRL